MHPRLLLQLAISLIFGCGLINAQTTGAQHLVFSGLRSVASEGQFNAVLSAPNGNLYLLLDQKGGVRVLEMDANASTILAQAQFGALGDIGLAMTFDPSGNLYLTGTSTSSTLTGTAGTPYPSRIDSSTHSYVAKLDPDLNLLWLSFTGSTRTVATSIAASADAVFVSGSLFSATLPVTSSAIQQTPASGSTQNGFVEKFNAAGTSLLYATYLTGFNGDTAPAAVAADSSDNAYIAGYTTSAGYPTLHALIPNSLGTPSGFLTKLTPAGDGFVFSTFLPGSGITSLALDSSTQSLLLSGTIALGQFPITNVQAPLVAAPYQTLLRLPLDGSNVLSSKLLAPGVQSLVSTAPDGTVWISSTLPASITAPLLPLTPLAYIGNSYALRVNAQNLIDQTIRLGGSPTTNPSFASIPGNLTSLAVDVNGQPIFAGSINPTASASLLTTQTYDLSLTNPTAALSSTLHDAVLTSGTCNGSLCAGSAAWLSKLNPNSASPSLVLSTDDSPNINLRNLGSSTATGISLNANGFSFATNCAAALEPAGECSIALNGAGPGTLIVTADNATTRTVILPATTEAPAPIVFTPSEVDFGIATATTPIKRTIAVTNLSQKSVAFPVSGASSYFTETGTDCTFVTSTTRLLAPNSTCNITYSFTASATTSSFIQANFTIGTRNLHLAGYSQTIALNLSASEIDFGTLYTGGIRLPRYLYLSNNSATATPHTTVTLPPTSPFVVVDRCPSTLQPHTVCQFQLDYHPASTPSTDSTALALDQGLSALITGTSLPQPGVLGASANPNVSVTPTTLNFPNSVVTTSTSSATQTATITNTGTQPFPLTLALTGDFASTTNCPALLAGVTSCSVLLTFAPSQPGARQGLLSVTAGSNFSPTTVALSGAATPILTANNGTLDFGNISLGQPSVQWYKITQPFSHFKATSTGDFTALLVEDLGYGHGQPATSSFSVTATGPCTNCWLGIQFKPAVAGGRTGTVALSSLPGGSSYSLTLTGNGLSLTGLLLTPTLQDFGPVPIHSSSPFLLFTLTNLTNITVNLSSPSVSSNFAISNNSAEGAPCTGTLAATASCFIAVTFIPAAQGPITGTLNVSGLTIALTGYGLTDPGLAVNPNALIFTNAPGTDATQQTIILSNTGNIIEQIGTPSTDSSNFVPTTNCAALAPGALCTITITFTPSTYITTATLQIPVTATGTLNTYTVPLTGSYTTENAGIQILPTQSSYGPTATNNLGPTRQFTIKNLTPKSLALDIALPRQFVLTGPPCAGLAPNASCNFAVAFLPLTNGDITGTLFAQATPTDGSATINGLGYVEGYGIGTGTLSITGNLFPGTLLNFGQVASGQSAVQILTLTNRAATPITIHRITSQWPFLSTTNCDATLTLNQSCTITLTYTPTNQLTTGTLSPVANSDAGVLTIESDAASSPNLIDLAGNAAPILVAAPANTAPLIAFTASQSSLTFATTAAGNASATQTVTLSNIGIATVHIAGLQSTPDFIAQSDCDTLVPAAACTVFISFTPQPGSTAPTRSSALHILSNSTTSLEFISLVGTGTPSTLLVSPTALDFGTVLVGTTATQTIQVTNSTAVPAAFFSITTTGDYTATGTCPSPGNTLAPNTTCNLQITFTPAAIGTRPGSVNVTTSLSTLSLSALLSGIGAQSHLQITPSTLNFGSIALAASANLSLLLSNTGTAPVTNIVLNITGDYAVTTPCPTTLVPAATCLATVTFSPTATGPRSGTLTLTNSDPSSPTTVPLTGTGIVNGSFLFTVDGTATSSITVKSGLPATYNLTVTPQNGFAGTVVLNCSPITPAQYATCALLPSSVTLSSGLQNAVATITTVASVATARNTTSTGITLCLCLPLLLFVNRRRRASGLLLALINVSAIGCGGGGDPNIRYAPPGLYRYQITANSTSGTQITQTVTVNLTITPR